MKFKLFIVMLSVLSSALSTSILKYEVSIDSKITLTPYRSNVINKFCQCKAALFVDPYANAVDFVENSDGGYLCNFFIDIFPVGNGKFVNFSSSSIAIFKNHKPDCVCNYDKPPQEPEMIWLRSGTSVFRFALKGTGTVDIQIYTSTEQTNGGWFRIYAGHGGNKYCSVYYMQGQTAVITQNTEGVAPYIMKTGEFVNFWIIMYNGNLFINHDGISSDDTQVKRLNFTVPTIKQVMPKCMGTCSLQYTCYCQPSIYKSYNNKNMIIYKQMNNFKVFFVEAVEYCQIYNSKMFIPESLEDYQWMKDQLDSLNEFTSMWFPANDTITSGTMTWIDGKSYTDRNLATVTGQATLEATSSTAATYNCATIMKLTDVSPTQYSLDVVGCFTHIDTFICEIN